MKHLLILLLMIFSIGISAQRDTIDLTLLRGCTSIDSTVLNSQFAVQTVYTIDSTNQKYTDIIQLFTEDGESTPTRLARYYTERVATLDTTIDELTERIEAHYNLFKYYATLRENAINEKAVIATK